MLRRVTFPALAAVLAACASRPPADFAPDPGLVARIREIRIITAAPTACPGNSVRASYEAVLDDGTLVPFAPSYDEDDPPQLHVMFLARTSNAATPLQSGGWSVHRDPMLSVREGVRLSAVLKARPELSAEAVLTPEYSCLPHAFTFEGEGGERGEAGRDGPDITVRLGVVRSPFHPRLLVAQIDVEQAPPVWVLADAETVPPADWLRVESRGGDGGRGVDGARGAAGAAGTPGCPGSAGGAGGAGGVGGRGATGGRGGRITIVAPQEEPFLAGLVEARTPGGEGGAGGRGGPGGPGGKGGAASPAEDRRCQPGADGAAGPAGAAGAAGNDGEPGSRPQVITVPLRDVFGSRSHPEIVALLRQQ
jgi:hypothetical protein